MFVVFLLNIKDRITFLGSLHVCSFVLDIFHFDSGHNNQQVDNFLTLTHTWLDMYNSNNLMQLL